MRPRAWTRDMWMRATIASPSRCVEEPIRSTWLLRLGSSSIISRLDVYSHLPLAASQTRVLTLVGSAKPQAANSRRLFSLRLCRQIQMRLGLFAISILGVRVVQAGSLLASLLRGMLLILVMDRRKLLAALDLVFE